MTLGDSHNVPICILRSANFTFSELIALELVRVQKNPFFKSPTHWVLGFLFAFGLYVFRIFLFERAVWKLVDTEFSLSATLLLRFASTLDYLKCANSLLIGR